MSGAAKAALIIALAVVALVGLNVAMWRRAEATIAAAKAEQERDATDTRRT